MNTCVMEKFNNYEVAMKDLAKCAVESMVVEGEITDVRTIAMLVKALRASTDLIGAQCKAIDEMHRKIDIFTTPN